VINLRTSIKPLMVAITSAILFASLSSYAAPGDGGGTGDGSGSGSGDDTGVANPYVETDAKRIKLDYPLGNMESWLAEADKYALNPVNIRAGKHPDRSDPNGGEYDVVYIFPSEADANAWWDGTGSPPDEIPDDAVAFIHWELDNGSGTFPGIMSKADIDGFKSKNCIMAAGATIPQPGVKDGIEKTCNNPQGASKRYKMNVLKADLPIDLVYNVEQSDLTYNNYETIPEHSGVPESGRIYRILQKWHNATAMNTANGFDNPGNRIVGFSMELGYGVGDDASDPNHFVAISTPADPGLKPDKILGFELRPCMADHFFDVKRDRPGTGTNPCSEAYDGPDPETDQALPQEIWLEEEYSTFSPKMYSFNTDKRTTPLGGWWDKKPAGIYPPTTQTLGKLDSGTEDSSSYYPPANPDRVDTGTLNATLYKGAATGNYFDITESQAAGYIQDLTLDTNGIIDPPGPFGYLMYFGVLSDDDLGILIQGVYEDADGDPSSEGDLVAWWDGDEYRWGSDPTYNGEIDDDNFSIVPREKLVEWSLFPLQEEPDEDGNFPTGPLYEVGILDDLAGLNVDSFVYLGREYDAVAKPNFTVRLTTVSVETGLGYSGGEIGNQTPAWVANPPKELLDYINKDGVVFITAEGYAGDPLSIVVADLLVTDNFPVIVMVENLTTGEVENVTLVQNPDEPRTITGSLPTAASGTAGANNDGTLNVWPLDTIRVTYYDEGTEPTGPDAGEPALRTDETVMPLETIEPIEPTPPSDDSSSGCSCSHSPDGSVDPILPAVVLFALGYLGLRRREERSK